MEDDKRTIVLGGVPARNYALYWRMRFKVGDPASIIDIPGAGSTLIIRDIEMERARGQARADFVKCPADFEPRGGLSGDREIATAQATAEFLRQSGIKEAWTDRSLPMIFAHSIREAGIGLRCDPMLGIVERRAKDAQEVAHLRAAQEVTEEAVAMACHMIARADADVKGALHVDGAPLTSEWVRSAIDVWLLERGYANPTCIVAGGPGGADCHNSGSGQLFTGQPVIIDVFPQNKETLYNGDCTRTVVHGDVPEKLQAWHAAISEAKAAGIAATSPGVTGEDVHRATIDVIRKHGFEVGLPPSGASASYVGMVHGTGHGVGLEVHEPPLLDFKGPELVEGDCLTIEPGLYCAEVGGMRLEDMVVVTADGCMNLNQVSEDLSW